MGAPLSNPQGHWVHQVDHVINFQMPTGAPVQRVPFGLTGGVHGVHDSPRLHGTHLE